ncbi:MAG: cyclic pyranopterin monophosphate synthase MoaC [Chthoniobacterales bacterium]|jgi:cyclic pyranopterin phosphate synthase
MKKLSHVNNKGEARMVDVGGKPVVLREAVAKAKLVCAAATVRLLKKNALPKGDVLAVARVAGIQAAKQTAFLVPLCHVLPLDAVELDFVTKSRGVEVSCTVRTRARTGVEMEALTGASVAALTLYDMCKAVDKGMRIEGVRVTKKTKGAS